MPVTFSPYVTKPKPKRVSDDGTDTKLKPARDPADMKENRGGSAGPLKCPTTGSGHDPGDIFHSCLTEKPTRDTNNDTEGGGGECCCD